jgi:predicted aconitase with swiveling domain
MKKLKLYGRGIIPGRVQGEAIVTSQPISFFGGLDPEKGTIIERGHELEGMNVTGKILIFPRGKGSTVGSYVIYSMKKKGTAPAAIINIETEPIIAAGCVIANIPLIDKLNENPIKVIKTGDFVKVSGKEGLIEVKREE